VATSGLVGCVAVLFGGIFLYGAFGINEMIQKTHTKIFPKRKNRRIDRFKKTRL
jgi:hypothetical protein